MKRAFGIFEVLLAMALIAGTVWAVGDTMLRRAAVPAWLHPAGEVWT